MSEHLFIEPLDVLYLRGNNLFDSGGAHGAALMPPWPSLAAGAIRSRMLVDHQVDPSTVAKKAPLPGVLGDSLGTFDKPGTFRISAFTIGCRNKDRIEPLFPLPADVIAPIEEQLQYLKPTTLHPALQSSYPLAQCPLLAVDSPSKPITGLWLNRAGIQAYIDGAELDFTCHCVRQADIWKNDYRLGIALNPEKQTADEGQIYTAETIAMRQGYGFLTSVSGADGLLPQQGFVRFGGDGRAAQIEVCKLNLPDTDWGRIAKEKRFRIVLTTPGIFADGWCMQGLRDNHSLWQEEGFSARLQAACVSRGEVISGWDMVCRCPKTAMRIAPTGSVYYFSDFDGDITSLKEVADQGLWPLDDSRDATRRAEGFNNIKIAAWPHNA
jgi:CRISPR-associated protein Cmr3